MTDGRRLYRGGIGVSGQPVLARVGPGDIELSATQLPCAGCHGRDGRGRAEGGVLPPPIHWQELAKPYGHRHGGARAREHPAFDAASFARAVTAGVDPAGQRLDPAMPRYALDESDLAALVAYLQQVEQETDPGVGDTTLRLGTLRVTDGPLAPLGATTVAVLRAVFARANARGGIHGRRLELVVHEAPASADPLRAWQELLEADVFAVLAPWLPGGGDTSWRSRADAAGVPVVALPVLPGVDPGARHVFQPVAGVADEVEALARFARDAPLLAPEPWVVAVRRGDPRAQEALVHWPGALPPVVEISADAIDPAIADWAARGIGSVFLLAGEAEARALVGRPLPPAFRPALLLPAGTGAALLAQGERTRWPGTVHVAVPMLPGDQHGEARGILIETLATLDRVPGQGVLAGQAYAVASVLLEGLRRSGRALSRAGLVGSLEGLHDYAPGSAPAVAFGPGRRRGASGVHILAPQAGAPPHIVRFVRLDGGAP